MGARTRSPGQSLGAWAEDLVAEHLTGLGWTVLQRNWRCAQGEVDLVAQDPSGSPTTVLVEVKCRGGRGFGDPLEAITSSKLARMRRLVACWRRAHPDHRQSIRLDAVGVLARPGYAPQLTHLRGIG